jgi:hypothetical protein
MFIAPQVFVSSINDEIAGKSPCGRTERSERRLERLLKV